MTVGVEVSFQSSPEPVQILLTIVTPGELPAPPGWADVLVIFYFIAYIPNEFWSFFIISDDSEQNRIYRSRSKKILLPVYSRGTEKSCP